MAACIKRRRAAALEDAKRGSDRLRELAERPAQTAHETLGFLAVFYYQTTMLPIYSLTFILGVVCAIFYYRAGESENSSGLVWAGLSAVISLVLWTVAHAGFVGTLLGQVGLFAGLTLWRCRGK